jgi:hypothetical protein
MNGTHPQTGEPYVVGVARKDKEHPDMAIIRVGRQWIGRAYLLQRIPEGHHVDSGIIVPDIGTETTGTA